MKTNDIVKRGINRNFIRECERQGLISPTRAKGTMVIDENYFSREYSDSDLNIIWGSLLLRKMDVSFIDIKRWWNGEIVDIRRHINDSIEKYEHQIEELQTTIEFMKYVRGTGIFPDPPKELKEVSSFKKFLIEYMKSIDSNGNKKAMLGYIHRELELRKIPQEELTEEQRLEISKIDKNIERYQEDCLKEMLKDKSYIEFINNTTMFVTYFSELVAIKEQHLDFSSKEAQEKICEIYITFKKSINKEELKPFEFSYIMCCFCSERNDLTEWTVESIGKENVEYFCNATLEFARIEDLETYNNFLNRLSST